MASHKLPKILGVDFTMINFPESLLTDEIERQIAASLPVIAGLSDVGMSDFERLEVLSRTVASQRGAFMAAHGDPFGVESVEIDVAVMCGDRKSLAVQVS